MKWFILWLTCKKETRSNIRYSFVLDILLLWNRVEYCIVSILILINSEGDFSCFFFNCVRKSFSKYNFRIETTSLFIFSYKYFKKRKKNYFHAFSRPESMSIIHHQSWRTASDVSGYISLIMARLQLYIRVHRCLSTIFLHVQYAHSAHVVLLPLAHTDS